jgi:hypothetical protein
MVMQQPPIRCDATQCDPGSTQEVMAQSEEYLVYWVQCNGNRLPSGTLAVDDLTRLTAVAVHDVGQVTRDA